MCICKELLRISLEWYETRLRKNAQIDHVRSTFSKSKSFKSGMGQNMSNLKEHRRSQEVEDVLDDPNFEKLVLQLPPPIYQLKVAAYCSDCSASHRLGLRPSLFFMFFSALSCVIIIISMGPKGNLQKTMFFFSPSRGFMQTFPLR